MKIIETYIIEYGTSKYYKLYECMSINSFDRSYFEELPNGELHEINSKDAKELIEISGM